MDNFSDNLHSLIDKIENAFFAAGHHFGSAQITSIFLFVLLLTVCLCLILVWYVRSVLAAVQKEREIERQNRRLLDNRLDKPVMEKQKTEEMPTDDNPADKKAIEDGIKAQSSKNNKNKKAQPFDFDWKRKTAPGAEKIPAPDVFQYQFKPKKLIDLLGMIVDLIERKVDDLKIAQSVMYKNQHLNSEDDIIQTVAAVNYFIFLCVNRRFQKLTDKKILPQEDAAIFHIANGDCSLAMVLLEELIDAEIKKTPKMAPGKEQNKAWAEISNYAVIFGTLAIFHDVKLAAGAFELAIELNPRNVTAWGRLGDMYIRSENFEKAVWAYANVLNIADEGIYTPQIANANKMLAIYRLENGRRQNAAALRKNADNFYNSIGINQPLNKEEDDILQFMENKREENLENVIDSLFAGSREEETNKPD